TQKPELHCVVAVQGLPGEPIGLQAPALQKSPLTQSAVVLHGLVQAPFAQAYGEQSCPPVGTVQVPVPLQTWPTTTVPWHDEMPHEVPCAQSWQAPAPSHWPFCPQLVCADVEHSSSGSVPARMGPQV